MTVKTVINRILKKPAELVIFHVPVVRNSLVSILTTRMTNEVSEQCLVEFLVKRHARLSGSDFSIIDIGAGPPPPYYEICMKYTRHVY